MSKRNIGIAAILGISILLVSLVGLRPIPEKTIAPYTGAPQKIVIGNIGEFSIFNLIAKEKGFFGRQGLDAEVKEYPSGPPAVAALLAGEVDITAAAEFVGVSNMFAHPQIRILSQASKHNTWHLVARKDKGIQKESDVKGKKIGVTRKGTGEFFLGRFLTFSNIALEDITIVDLPPAEMISRLKKGTVDAIVIFDPHAYVLKKELGDTVHMWSAQAEQKTLAVLYTTEAFIQKEPEQVARYMEALVLAQQYLEANPQEAQAMLARIRQYDAEYIAYMWPNFHFSLGLSQELLLTMEDQARWLIDHGIVKAKSVPNYLNHIYSAPLESVKPASITLIQ